MVVVVGGGGVERHFSVHLWAKYFGFEKIWIQIFLVTQNFGSRKNWEGGGVKIVEPSCLD